jgi:hypothetical protein
MEEWSVAGNNDEVNLSESEIEAEESDSSDDDVCQWSDCEDIMGPRCHAGGDSEIR